MAFVREWLTEAQIEEIKHLYPMEHWRIELKLLRHECLRFDELAEMFTRACLYTDA